MKKIKFCAATSVLFRVTFSLVISLFLPLCLAGCPEEEEDYSISKITFYNIPANIPVYQNEAVSLSAFKIYLNASNSMSESDPPAAKGVAKFSDFTPENGKYSITIQLQNPNPSDKEDPNEDTGSWSGEAKYFSVVISPHDVTTHGENAIWMKAGTTLNKGKERYDWNSLMDSRTAMALENDPMEFAPKVNSLYTDIVCKDPDITKP
jgi:hypothetical protein